MAIQIFDMDNCLSDDEHRIYCIDFEQEGDAKWDMYHSLAPLDLARNLDVINEQDDMVIFTARPEHFREQTQSWLTDNIPFGRIKHIYMRPQGNQMHSAELKLLMLNQLFSDYNLTAEDIACAYDDRQDVVDAYINARIPAQVLKIHNTCAYTKPEGDPR